ncbi:cation:dicarboxylate symporter family transporter [Streptomyces sp. RKCA744]|uniref:cation:dicarboxylate symporter family transporter n=1 Tax=Streptomyces sp. RKCA744 TaxID=2959340 RepID=UPI0020A05F4F|nr:cation:dicarboxylase symporter family transporter [Streptomyces sp. RKCA744]MCO8303324.1 cation:dicarboxylase symporter family transporter [Streptomyces sp. RKCA744]
MSATAARGARAGRDRTHYLYLAVIVATLLGIGLGFAAPDAAVELKPVGTGFVNLIKMMISPIIFCTIVIGIGSVRKAAKVGAVGGLTLVYFLAMSTVALAVGLLVGNVLEPGHGLTLTESARNAGEAQAEGAESTTAFLLGIIPTTVVSAFTGGEVLQTVLIALLAGFAVQAMGEAGRPLLTGIGHIQRLVFRLLSMVMTMASLFIAEALGEPLALGQQITLLAFMVVASKGAAGVTGSGLVTLAGGLQSHRPELVDGVGLIIGIDRFMSEARALTNFAGNAVATVLIGTWTKEIDRERAAEVLAGRLPFDETTLPDDGHGAAPGDSDDRGAPAPAVR